MFSFAEMYIENILEMSRQSRPLPVQIHDGYVSDAPSDEAQALFEWIAYSGRGQHVLSVEPLRFPDNFARLNAIRRRAGINPYDDVSFARLNADGYFADPPDLEPPKSHSPSIFFELTPPKR